MKRQRTLLLDENPKKAGGSHRGVPILKLDEARERLRGKKAVVTVFHRPVYEEIAAGLRSYGLEEFRDFCKMEEFLTEWYLQFRNERKLLEVHQAVTTRCTLYCAKCNMFIGCHQGGKDISLDALKRDADLFFKKVSYVYQFTLLGGEPLLNKELGSYITYLCKTYGNRIGRIDIVSNGTVLPDTDLLQVMRENRVFVALSDYTNTVPYEGRKAAVCAALNQSGIAFAVNRELLWRDFGFPTQPRAFEKVREHMLCCRPQYHGLNDGKYYYCHVSWSAEKCGLLRLGKGEYVDLADPSVSKAEIAHHSLGYFQKGYGRREMRRAVRLYPPVPGWRQETPLTEGLRRLTENRDCAGKA